MWLTLTDAVHRGGETDPKPPQVLTRGTQLQATGCSPLSHLIALAVLPSLYWLHARRRADLCTTVRDVHETQPDNTNERLRSPIPCISTPQFISARRCLTKKNVRTDPFPLLSACAFWHSCFFHVASPTLASPTGVLGLPATQNNEGAVPLPGRRGRGA